MHSPRDNQLTIVPTEIIDSDHQDNDACDSKQSPVSIELGQWYWVKDTKREYDQESGERIDVPYEWFGCVMHVGTNYVELRHPKEPNGGYSYTRVHFDEFWNKLRFEPNPDAVISNNVAHYQALASKHLEEVKAINARLGVSSQAAIAKRSAASGDGANALMVVSGQQDIKDYENALVLAKDKLLPELFEAIKKASGEVARWMLATTLPLEAASGSMDGTIDNIKDRIFNVSLYAGLTEQVVCCREGTPAQYHEKLRVMQRMLYMDEECLLNYRHGGMEFNDIESFDAWISEDINRDRILPSPRCLVAMRVRRNEKSRDWGGSLKQAFINFELKELDKLTFLYIRNGDQVHRLSCDQDFGQTLFPDKIDFDPGKPSMVKMFASRVDQIISRDDYDERVAKYELAKAQSEQWMRENPGNDGWDQANPFRESGFGFRPNDWKPFDSSNVYFDDISLEYAKKIKEHNRVALIIQGLYDRSEVLHPHAPAKLWSPEGFSSMLELVYDAAMTLHDGDAPDFEAYRSACNASIGPDSVVIGQELYWMEKEAEKECRRRDNDHRDDSNYRPTLYKPHGNPGPGYIARIAQWKPRARTATFSWHRERQTANWRKGQEWGDPLFTSISVPADQLFNVSAYKLGDYLQFFQDSRTRQQYLKWAPMLLAAEEYHSGRDMKVRQPVAE